MYVDFNLIRMPSKITSLFVTSVTKCVYFILMMSEYRGFKNNNLSLKARRAAMGRSGEGINSDDVDMSLTT